MTKTLLVFFATVLLAGCGANTKNTETSQSESTSTSSEITSSSTSSSKDTMEVKDGKPLVKVGQWTKTDDLGIVKLKKINTKVEPFVLADGVTLNIRDAKIFNSTDLRGLWYDVENKNGDYIQIQMEIANYSESEYSFLTPSSVVLSDGTQLDNSNFTMSTTDSVKPKAKKEIIFFILLGDKEVNSSTLYYDLIFNNTEETHSDKKEITINF